MINQKIKILILEDDKLFSDSLDDFLTQEGFIVQVAYDGEKALELCYEESFDLLLLDVNVPMLNGFEFLSKLRQNATYTPAIFITSFKDKGSIQKGFLKGGDDYLIKPIDVDELLLRIIALLRRSGKLKDTITINEAVYYPKESTIQIYDKRYTLSKKVTLLLDLLLEHKNSTVSLSQIESRLWDWDETSSPSSLRIYINKLKKILGKESIINQKGIGYRLEC